MENVAQPHDGWPSIRAKALSRTKLSYAGAPFLAFCARSGAFAPIGDRQRFTRHISQLSHDLQFPRAQESKAILRLRRLAFHHFQLLSASARSRHARPPRSVPRRAGANAGQVWLRRAWIRGHAGAFPSLDQRTATGNPVYSDTGRETGLRPPPPGAAPARWCRIESSGASLATSLL